MVMMYVPIVVAPQPPLKTSEMIVDTIGDPETMDPAWSYDTGSGEVISNVYETLLFYQVQYDSPDTSSQAGGPYSAGQIGKFYGLLATTEPTVGNGLIVKYDPPLTSPQGLPIYAKWTFPIRTLIPFHFGGGNLQPIDVEYSIERAIVQDRTGGPTWMLEEALLGVYWASPPSGLDAGVYEVWGDPDDAWGAKLDYAIQSDANNVYFYFANNYPDLAFKQVISQAWGAIVDRDWAVSEGDLPANWASLPWRDIWDPNHDGDPVDGWHDPATSFLEDAIGTAHKDGGTGPYQLDYWTPGTGYSMIKFDAYWQGWPSPISIGSASRLPGYFSRVTWNEYDDWTVRRDNFYRGDSDYTVVPRTYRDQVLGTTAPNGEPVVCFYRSKASGKAPVVLNMASFHMTLNLSSASPYGGTLMGLTTVASPKFSAAGMPLNLMGIDPSTGKDEGLNVRKGIAYAVDYDWFQGTVNLGESEQPASIVVKGLAYYNPANPKYNFDLTKAEYYLKLAWGGVDSRSGVPSTPVLPEDPTKVTPGPLWNTGMSFKVTYNTGNTNREMMSSEIASRINTLNPTKFNLQILGLTWGSVYLPAMVAHRLPIFNIGWQADYADPHDFTFPFQHSAGTYSNSQNYENPFVDAMVVEGIATPDAPYIATKTGPFTYETWQDRNKDGVMGVGDWVYNVNGDKKWWKITSMGPPMEIEITREDIYFELQKLSYEDVPTVPYSQTLVRHFEQPWMSGWYYNSLYPGYYYYHLWKAKTHYADINWDGTVDILDWSTLSSSWTGPPRGAAYFLPQCDLTGGIGGTTGSNEGPVKGIPNGAVEIDDLSMVSAYWD